jgi:hypothetical protein
MRQERRKGNMRPRDEGWHSSSIGCQAVRQLKSNTPEKSGLLGVRAKAMPGLLTRQLMDFIV